MTQPQQQPFTRGQRLDFCRSRIRSRIYPAPLTSYTVTVGGTAVTGVYSFDIDGITISYSATVPPDDNNVIAQGLVDDFNANTEALRLARVSLNGLVLTVQARTSDTTFVVDNAVAPGTGTLTPANTTPTPGNLGLGLGVALNGTEGGSIRTMAASDTAAALFGVSIESTELRLSTGDDADVDVYEPGSVPAVIHEGEVPVAFEGAATDLTDAVWLRIDAPGTEEVGAFRATDPGGGDAVQITNARWTGDAYSDDQGRLTRILLLNLP